MLKQRYNHILHSTISATIPATISAAILAFFLTIIVSTTVLFALPDESFARDYNYSDNVYTVPESKAKRVYSHVKRSLTSLKRELPACDDNRVLSLMSERARWADKNTWQKGNLVSQISRTHEHGKLDGLTYDGEERQINRRYCGADVLTEAGRKHYVWYLIEQGQGLASMGWNVEFCMAATDRWHVDDGHCRAIRTQY